MTGERNLKGAVAGTLKWNVIDRVATQLLYAVTGVVLANMLTKEECGLVEAVMVFQAFAQLFVDSGFASALIQRKSPTDLDYSTVLWFNLGMATVLYAVLAAGAPLIADIFQGDPRIVPLGRVMFLSFIINAAGIVQTNQFMKRMDVKPVTMANSAGLFAGAVVGIYLAVTGHGAWSIVWQTLTLGAVRTAILWYVSTWRPMMRFSWSVLRGFFAVGSGVMATSLLNTLFQNISSLIIGNRSTLGVLGYYAQANKWSKMGVMSLSQTLTSSFLPLLSEVQDDTERYRRVCAKTHRFTGYVTLPALILLTLMATPIFHTLFGTKWDASIPMFELLCLRGIFLVLSLLYGNYLISLGRSKLLVVSEAVRDGAALVAIGLTFGALSDGTHGIIIFLWGQLVAGILSWGVSLWLTVRETGRPLGAWLLDLLPYAAISCVSALPCLWIAGLGLHPLAECVAMAVAFGGVYIIINFLLRSKVQKEVLGEMGIGKS